VSRGRTGERSEGLYGDPSVYDVLAAPGTARDLDLLQRIARRWCSPPARRPAPPGRPATHPSPLWLEPACGTGRFVRLAARRGIRAVGFDREPGMVAYAQASLRRRGLDRRARVCLADLSDFREAARISPAAIDFAFVLDNTLRLLPDDAGVLAHFAQIAAVLRGGGVYAVGISLRGEQEPPDEDLWQGRRGRCRVTQVVNYLPPPRRTARREWVVSHVTISRPRGQEHRDDLFALRSYTPRQWVNLLERSALQRVASLDGRGRPLAAGLPPYQIELLIGRGDTRPQPPLAATRGGAGSGTAFSMGGIERR
jgi:SAM-dependent methyltransferase